MKTGATRREQLEAEIYAVDAQIQAYKLQCGILLDEFRKITAKSRENKDEAKQMRDALFVRYPEAKALFIKYPEYQRNLERSIKLSEEQVALVKQENQAADQQKRQILSNYANHQAARYTPSVTNSQVTVGYHPTPAAALK